MGPPFEEDICDGFPERDPCGDGETLDEDLWCYAWRIGKMLCEPDRQGQEDQADDKEDDGATSMVLARRVRVGGGIRRTMRMLLRTRSMTAGSGQAGSEIQMVNLWAEFGGRVGEPVDEFLVKVAFGRGRAPKLL